MSRDKAHEKRQRILDAALRVFAEHGFYNAKVSEVAREAGVADGTIYLYFKDKDDLLISLFEDRMDYMVRRLNDELTRTSGSVASRIRRLIHMHLNLATEAPDLAEFITVELRQSAKFVKEYENPKFQEYLTILRDLVEEGQRNGEIRPGLDSRIVVRAIFGALDETLLTLTLASQNRSVDLVAAAERVTDLFLDGMRNPGFRTDLG